jgi:hypothetical protein
MLSLPIYTYMQEKKKEGFAHLLQPMYAKVREHGAPVQGARLGEGARDLYHHERNTLTAASVAKTVVH